MNKIAVYIVLILIFLGLSKSFSPRESKMIYIKNERVFKNFFSGAPLSILLVDSFQTGFFIKSYYQKYRIVYGFQKPYYITVRTSKEFWEKNLNNVGMSLFRREEKNLNESSVPMPPGILYLNNFAYGNWVYHESGNRVWKFHEAYRENQGLNFPKFFGWNSYLPTKKFWQVAQIYLREERPYYGLNNEFGTNGEVTQIAFASFLYKKKKHKIKFQQYLNRYFMNNNSSGISAAEGTNL